MALGVENYNGGTTDEYGTLLVVDRQMGSGVIEGLLVAANATPNMTVYVQPGSGLIPTGTYPSSYNYRFHIDTALPGASVTVATAAASPRIDYIVAYVDKTVTGSNAGANVNNTNAVLKLADVQGTPAGSPSVPTVSQIQNTIGASNPYVILAQIAVGANVTTVTNTNITDLRTFASDRNDAALGQQSYVDSGLVWSATSGLAASMTAGKAYINVGGTMVPASAAAISSYTFTASQDTYVSINVNGVINYNPVANNANSPTLPAGSIWLAIVVTNGTTVTTVNQGQIGAASPVISSRALNVSDSNGVLIYPTANQRIIGYAQITSPVNIASTSAAWVTGLTASVSIPAGRRARVTFYAQSISTNTASVYGVAGVYDGAAGPSNPLNQAVTFYTSNVGENYMQVNAIVSPSMTATSNKSYSVSLYSSATATLTVKAGTTFPAYIMVELI